MLTSWSSLVYNEFTHYERRKNEMEKRQQFKRIDIEQMKKKREALEASVPDEITLQANKAVDFINTRTDEAVVALLQELGFKEAKSGMSIEDAEKIHDELRKRGQYLNISTRTEGFHYIVCVSLVHELKTLEFDISSIELKDDE